MQLKASYTTEKNLEISVCLQGFAQSGLSLLYFLDESLEPRKWTFIRKSELILQKKKKQEMSCCEECYKLSKHDAE